MTSPNQQDLAVPSINEAEEAAGRYAEFKGVPHIQLSDFREWLFARLGEHSSHRAGGNRRLANRLKNVGWKQRTVHITYEERDTTRSVWVPIDPPDATGKPA